MKKLFLLLAMLAVLCSGVAGDISPLEGVPVLGMPKAEAFETKPVNFVVIDRARSVGKADMRGWIQMVKMDYHVPYYRLMDDNTKANAAVDEMFAKNPKPDKEALKAAGCQWCSKKKLWSWKPAGKRYHSYRGTKSMAEIRTKYGSQTFTRKADEMRTA